MIAKQNDLAASRKLIDAPRVPRTASVKFYCAFIYHRQLAGVFNWKRWKIPRSIADIGYTSYRLHQSGTNGGSKEMAAATTVIVLFWEACMSAFATSEKRLLLLLLLLLLQPLDADQWSVSRLHSSTRRCDLSLRRGRPRLLHHSTTKSTSSAVRRRRRRPRLWCPRLQEGRGRFRPGPDTATTRHSASWRLLRWLRIVRRWIGQDQEENPTRPNAGRLICNGVGSRRRAVVVGNWRHRSATYRDKQELSTWRYADDRLAIWLSDGRVRRP